MPDPSEGVRLAVVRVDLIGRQGEYGHVSESRVQHYQHQDPAGWPRLSLVERGGRYMLVDGAHRITAARRLGLARVRASVVSAATWADWCAHRRRLSWRRWEGER